MPAVALGFLRGAFQGRLCIRMFTVCELAEESGFAGLCNS